MNQESSEPVMAHDGLTVRPSNVIESRVLNGGSNGNESRIEESFISEKDSKKGIKPKKFRAVYPKQTKFSRGLSRHRLADKFWKKTQAVVVSRDGNSRIEYRQKGTSLKRKINGKRIVNYPHFVLIDKRGRKNC